MNMISSSAPDIKNPNGIIHTNTPINTDYVVYMSKRNVSKSDGWAEQFTIRFMLTTGQTDWHYDNELTRDNRYAEILQHLGTKLF